MSNEKWSEGLPDRLREVASYPDKVLSVLSGPGTGKTLALVARAARFVAEGGDPKRILFVTFTRTAARDLQEKIAGLKVELAAAIDARTLHSLCLRILQEERALAATGRVARPLLKYEQDCLLRDLTYSTFGGITQRRERLAAFEAAWARLDSDNPAGWPTDPVDQKFKHELETWLKFHRGLLLAELVPITLTYLRQDPKSTYVGRYEHVLVDEYQDLNRAEQVLIDVLAGQQATVSVIGDDDQSIYTTLRNAYPEGIVNFPYRHAATRAETLQLSMRCPPNIVSMANSFLTNVEMTRLTDRLIVPNESRPNAEIHVVRWKTLDREVKKLAKFIKGYGQRQGIPLGEILVLSPRRLIGYRIRDNLRELGIDAMSFFHEEALDNDPARERFTLLTLLADREDRVALRCWLGMPTPRPAAYREVWEHCESSGESPWLAMNRIVAGEVSVSKNVSELSDRFLVLSERIQTLDGLVGMQLATAWLGDPAADTNENLRDLRDMSERICSEDPQISPVGLKERLLEEITQPELPTDQDCVRVMSLHKSKGLTARLVIVAGFAQGLIPFVKSGLTPEEYHRHMQEQRRLFFVALTRATDCLVLSSAKRIRRKDARDMNLALPSYGQHWVQSSPSQFATQLGPDAPQQALDGDDWLSEALQE